MPDGGALRGETPDLATRGAISDLVTSFYREIVFDDLLEPVFGEVAEVDWPRHIPVLIDYWVAILLGVDGPRGSLMGVHRHLHGLAAIEREHCDRWYSLWVGCVDERWAGPLAERAKAHAAAVMAGMAKHVFSFRWSASEVAPRPLPGRLPA
ncbi:group III truncated hemoglobin [Iamia sp. SCSIO 61187]|uniref:group III truncated hemoglobin n=1 Tax=Iamia sp. SCSIO 61187 TaxID=2722752 RepID=UPI001C637B08|nr:group III truncated hemoglobin [Iamia sp. SCSIO 61187]QYG94070.1 group III truncated hemoglobin [Iamia sp. SCSIO 61187]